MALKETLNLLGGMGLLLTGQKLPALGVFAKGLVDLEKEWRERHPEVPVGVEARWQAALAFYEQTHSDPMNRKLHMVGIPMIAGGVLGLVVGTPLGPIWLASAVLFAAGSALNIVGHMFFEKNSPAFAEDPLSFVAGPVWDLQQLFHKRNRKSSEITDEAVAVHCQAVLN